MILPIFLLFHIAVFFWGNGKSDIKWQIQLGRSSFRSGFLTAAEEGTGKFLCGNFLPCLLVLGYNLWSSKNVANSKTLETGAVIFHSASKLLQNFLQDNEQLTAFWFGLYTPLHFVMVS